MITLSPEQRREIADCGEKPVRAIDPDTKQTYVIISEDRYFRIRALLDDEPFDIRETYAAQDAALARVWDAPDMDEYNDYDAHKPK